MLTGTDTGFAITPYGEWNARELELFVEDLGFTPAAALRAATEVNAGFMTEGGRIGVLEPGRAFKVLHRNVLGSGLSLDFGASPAISDGKLFLRSQSYLYCIGGK